MEIACNITTFDSQRDCICALCTLSTSNTLENNTWTLPTAIKEIQEASVNESHIEQTFKLDTDPVIETNFTDLSRL